MTTHDRHAPVVGAELPCHGVPASPAVAPLTTQDAIPHISKLSHLMDDMEQLADEQFFTIACGSPQALGNLLARLERLQLTIELAAGL